MNLDQALRPFIGKYSASFLSAVAFVIDHEVVFSDGHYGDYNYVSTEHDHNDPGGTTRYGIDAAGHPGLGIEHLTLAGALAAYFVTWRAIRADAMPADVAMTLLDTAENVGTLRAIEWLQAAVGAKQDGQVGPKTLAAIASAGDMAVDGLLDYRQSYYEHTISPRLQRIYLKGWLNRVADLRRAVNLPVGQMA